MKTINNEFKQRIKNIKNHYRSEIFKVKSEYKTELAKAKEDRDGRVIDYYKESGKHPPQNPPKRPILEEIGNAVTHGLGSLFSVVALILMLIASNGFAELTSAIIYFVGLFLMFTMSCLYHAFPHGSAVKRLFRRFDYSGIYLLIGATFAPVLICYFGDAFGFSFFAIQWLIIAAGISLVGVFGPTRLAYVHVPMYVILGWSALALLPRMMETHFSMAMWILAGGVLYTLGIIPFLIKSKVSHFIWHFFVLAGAVSQWIGIYLYIYLI